MRFLVVSSPSSGMGTQLFEALLRLRLQTQVTSIEKSPGTNGGLINHYFDFRSTFRSFVAEFAR